MQPYKNDQSKIGQQHGTITHTNMQACTLETQIACFFWGGGGGGGGGGE